MLPCQISHYYYYFFRGTLFFLFFSCSLSFFFFFKTYTATVLSKLPKLTRLDGRQITKEERQKHVGGVEMITKSLIRQYAKGTGALSEGGALGGTTASSQEQTSGEVSGGGVNGSGNRPDAPSSPTARPPVSPDSGSGTDNFVIPPSATGAAAATSATSAATLSSSIAAFDDDPWWRTVESLDLNHRNLQKIEHLSQLKNLRRLSLADNEISQVEGLEHNTLLEELVLEENRTYLKVKNKEFDLEQAREIVAS